MSTLSRHKVFIKLSLTSKVIQARIRPLLCQNHSNTFVYRPIIKICMNGNIMTTQFFHQIMYVLMSLLCYEEVLCFFFTLWPSDLIPTLTYVIIDNCCPCFYAISSDQKYVISYLSMLSLSTSFTIVGEVLNERKKLIQNIKQRD